MTTNKQESTYSSKGTSSYQSRDDEPFTFEIVKLGSFIGERKKTGFCKELNFVSYKGAPAKWDIREWNEDHTKMSRGITLTLEELIDLGRAIGEIEVAEA